MIVLEIQVAYNCYCFVECTANCKTSACDKDTGACTVCDTGFWGESCKNG